jgi:cellulose synthase/poly-beta-1,6-N-acetylglucosamine synthase-like glycosyltransferase
MLPSLEFIGKPLIYILVYLTLFSGFYILFIFLEYKKNFRSPKPKKLPRVSIVIPVYNGAKYIEACLKSIQNLDYPKDKLETIVVDDGSQDNSFEEAKKFKFAKVFRKKHSGKAKTVNYGINRATGEIMGVLDCDSIVEKDTLKKMIGFFNDKNVGAVVSGIRVYKPRNLLEKFQEIEYTITLFFRKNLSFVKSLYVTPGVLSLYRKSIFKKIGKFKDNVTEDLEIALRILSHNYEVRCAPEAKTYTIVPNKFRDLQKQRVRWNYGLLMNLKNYSFLFSRKYKDLGFILPFTLLTNFFLVIFFSYIIINFVFDIVNTFYIISLTGIETYLINTLNFKYSLGFLSSEFFIYFITTLIFSIMLLFYALSVLNVKFGFKSVFQYLTYLAVSGYLYFYFWFVTLYKFLRKDITW